MVYKSISADTETRDQPHTEAWFVSVVCSGFSFLVGDELWQWGLEGMVERTVAAPEVWVWRHGTIRERGLVVWVERGEAAVPV